MSRLKDQGVIEATTFRQRAAVHSGLRFSRTARSSPAGEPGHAIGVTGGEVLRAKEAGEVQTIL